jgi:hypothetical protein
MNEPLINVGRFFKRQFLFQRMEVIMSKFMDLLRGPALGVIIMIILLAGAIIITAFAALIAQMSLLLRLKLWNTSEKHTEGVRSETEKKDNRQETYAQRPSTQETQRTSSPNRQHSPQAVVVEPDANEVIDAVWWETER